MSMQRMLFRTRKSKSGISTILGMLIFIGVLFTCVIPLFLYVNEMNNTYDRTVVEMKNFDEDRTRELLDVNAYPLGQTSTNISLYIKNKCPLTVEVKRVWINNYVVDLSLNVSSMQFNITNPINLVSLLPTQGTIDFKVKVTTTRGNSFASLTNPLTYTAGSGWAGSIGFGINIVLEKKPSWWWFGTYNFTVYDVNTQQVFCNDYINLIFQESYFKHVSLPSTGTYNVTVYKGNYIGWWPSGHWTWQKIHSENDVITWENPSKWVYVTTP